MEMPRSQVSFALGIFYFSLIFKCSGLPSIIKIGGLFETEDDEQEMAFRFAVDRLNSERKILPKSRLEAVVERLKEGDSFAATKKVCSLLEAGVIGIFGPQSDTTSMHVTSICDEMEVAHVKTSWDYLTRRDDLSINLYPTPCMLSLAYVTLVEHLGWKNFTLIYEENEGIIRLQKFLKEASRNNWNIQVYRFDENAPYREVFWQVKRDLKKLKEKNHKIVLDVSRRNLHTVLKHAQQTGMITEYQQYIITSLDFHTIDLEDFKYGKANVTGFRLVKESNKQYKMLLQEITSRSNFSKPNGRQIFGLKTETALMFDAVRIFAQALKELDRSKEVPYFPPMSCKTGAKGTEGTSIINYMKSSTSPETTSDLIAFDGQGFRSMFNLDLVFLSEEGLVEIGSMLSGRQPNITRNMTSSSEFEHRKYIITTIVSPPYVMLKNSSQELTGNERYEGFCINLVEALSQILHFSYEIRLVKDGQYGKENETTGTWTGMIGEVMREEAHMAVAGLSISSKREKAVDFTMPFMNTGISILFKKPMTKVKSLFSFLLPFSGEVWIYLVGAYFGVSFVTFFIGRLTPYEWNNPYPCRQDDVVVENTFNVRNSLWFIIGSLMQQGSELVPTSFCTRTAASFWNFFTLIMVSSYTANLAAFLTVEKVVYPIENAEQLAKQTKIKYGCIDSGTTRDFFKESNIPVYKSMWKFMSEDPSVLVDSDQKGVDKVYQGGYAYLMESTTIEYRTERECSLTGIGGLLDSKGYGIATKKGNRDMTVWLSSGILKLQENGFLHNLKTTWWKQMGGGKCGDASKKSSKVTELGLGNVGGVFVVLIFGLLAAIFIAFLEFWWKYRLHEDPNQESFWVKVKHELKFALSCESVTKPAAQHARKKSPGPTSTLNSRSSIPGQETN